MNSSAKQVEDVIQYLCEKHGIARTDYLQIEHQPRENRFAVMFRPAQYSREARNRAATLSVMLNEPFRGDVARAAVPVLAAELDLLLQEILEPKPLILYVDEHLLARGWY